MAKTVDLTHNLNEKTPVFYDGDVFSLKKAKSADTDFYNSYLLKTTLHTGTHIDMPLHLIEGRPFSNSYSLDNFIGKGCLIDARGKETISPSDVCQHIIKSGQIPLFYSGFDRYFFADKSRYANAHPQLSPELVEFLIEKKPVAIGLDFPSPDRHPFALHKKLLENNIFIIENMTNLGELLVCANFEVFAVPLKLEAEASLVRAFARVYE